MIPIWLTALPLDLISAEAQDHQLPWEFLAAIVSVESNGDTHAVRYEPTWHYFESPNEYAGKLGISGQTETQLQSCSWGLGQVMGSVARELGWQGPLQGLCEPEVGLHYAALKVEQLWKKYGGLESDVAAAYNAGTVIKTTGGMYRNQIYVDKVDQKLRELRELK